jgi:hypothetical protein
VGILSPAEAPLPDDLIIVPLGSAGAGYRVVDWMGNQVGTVPVAQSVFGSGSFAAQSPDGSHFIADLQVNHIPTRAVLTSKGQEVGALDPRFQYQWADDNRHICLVQNPVPGVGQQSTLLISDLGNNAHVIGVLGIGTAAQDTVHTATVCSVSRDVAVILDERMVAAGPSGFEVATSSIRKLRLSTLQVLHTTNLSSTRVHVVLDPTGAYFAETSLDKQRRTQIIALDTAQVLSELRGRDILGFSGNDARILVGDKSESNHLVEVRETSNEHVITRLSGDVSWVQFRPYSDNLVLALEPAQAVPGEALGAGSVLIIDHKGAIIRVL